MSWGSTFETALIFFEAWSNGFIWSIISLQASEMRLKNIYTWVTASLSSGYAFSFTPVSIYIC